MLFEQLIFQIAHAFVECFQLHHSTCFAILPISWLFQSKHLNHLKSRLIKYINLFLTILGILYANKST